MSKRIWRNRWLHLVIVFVLLATFTLSSTGIAFAAGRSGAQVERTWYGQKITIYANSDACKDLQWIMTGGTVAAGAIELWLTKWVGWTPPGRIAGIIVSGAKILFAANAWVISYGASHNGMYFTLLLFELPGKTYVTPGVIWYQ